MERKASTLTSGASTAAYKQTTILGYVILYSVISLGIYGIHRFIKNLKKEKQKHKKLKRLSKIEELQDNSDEEEISEYESETCQIYISNSNSRDEPE